MYSQRGSGLGDLFRNLGRKVPILKPVVKEAKGIGQKVALKLAENLITDLVSGKASKASAKERGKQARDMAIQQSIQSIFHKGNGAFDGKDPPSESDLGFSETTAEREPPKKGTKRKRAESKKPAKKPKKAKKRTQKGGWFWNDPEYGFTKKGGDPFLGGRGKTQKGGVGLSWSPIWRKTVRGAGKQTGGVQPPIHYPLGNYPRGIRRRRRPIRRKQSGGMPIWLRLIMGRGKGKKRTGKKRTVTKASLDDIFS